MPQGYREFGIIRGMLQVLKWVLPIENEVLISDVPRNARPLYVHEQRGELCIWMLCDPLRPMCCRKLRIAGIGHTIDDKDGANYVGTAMMNGSTLVFHVFDLGEI